MPDCIWIFLLGKGVFAGHAFFLFRGTQYLADWLTNLNVGVSRSASGFPIHDGFHTAFQSMKPQLKEYMASVAKHKITHIHCIGHSLGGALATICADWIRSAYNRSSYLYTYGSPRVGLQDFAAHCTHNLGSNKIFRVYHSTDIVPCIPIWPYYHTPYQTQDYWIHSPGFLPTPEYHDMAKYVKSVAGKPWPVLASLREQHTKFSILQWLKSQTVSGFTMKTLELLNRAIVYVLEKCWSGASWLVSKAATTSFTLLDRLAYILSHPNVTMRSASDLVISLINKILKMVGIIRKVKKEHLTREYIRNVLLLLQQKANAFARDALGKAMVSGRHI
ncbi:MAG: lipase family protein [Cellvibrio sp.]